MKIVYGCCCGLDVHKKLIVACLLKRGRGGKVSQELRQFGTTTKELLALNDWLVAAGCRQVAMESTGVYWKPVYNILEGHLEVLVINAQHVKQVPGRKTDVQDAEWIAQLLQHGLLRGSFVPPRFIRQLREVTRYRSTVVQERARVVNRLQKVLESANLKLASVVSDIQGASARAMLEALVGGQTHPEVLAQLARGTLRQKRAQLEEALTGRVTDHHRFLIAEHLSHIDYLEETLERLSAEIERRLRPFDEALALLDTIPGVNRRTAEVILAECGTDWSRFPSAGHLASWAGMCPGHNESAGQRHSGKTRKGSPWLRHALVEAAHGASHTKNTYLRAQYHRLAGRRGKKKALMALGHTILVIAYHVLTRQQPYLDLGANYFDERAHQAVQRRCVRRLERLGYSVALQPMSHVA